MADLYPSGHHSIDRGPTPSSNENIPSTTVWEPDPSSEMLLHNDTQDHSPTGGDRSFRYLCYGLHAFLVAVHIVLVGMLFTHPEHSFSVSINNTGATIALRIFLHAFYLIYTIVLVFLTQRLALTALMTQRQTLTAVHDISGAWNGIGAAIGALWQQTKVTSSPSALVLVFIYLSCISGLHIISSSVIQFEAFNNTVTSVVPSSLTWTSSSVNLSTLDWGTIAPLMAMWPLLPTAKGLSGGTLFDVPSPDYAYTGAAVNATTISAECGLLSNLSAVAFNSTDGLYYVDVNGLGEVGLQVQELVDMVLFMDFTAPSPGTTSCSMCDNYVGYQVTTALGLSNPTGEVFQLDLEGPAGITVTDEPGHFNVSTTSYFVACILNATTSLLHLSMQDGKITNTELLPNNSKEAEPWTVLSSGNTTELTQMYNIAQNTAGEFACQGLQFPAESEECIYMSIADRYLNSLLNISWVPGAGPTLATPVSPIVLEKNDMQNVIAQTAAALIWLAGTVGVDYGGFIQDQGERSISYDSLVFRLNVNTIPVIVGLFASSMLLATVVWMFHHSQPIYSKASITSPNILGLIYISAHSTGLQDFIKTSNSLPDQLRLKGIKAEACLANMKSESIRLLGNTDHNLQMDAETHSSSGHILEGHLSMHWLYYGLHAIFLAFHVVLVLLLIKHPEHNVTMASDNPWVTTAITVSLQAFYVLYTAGLVFITQQLSISAIIAQRNYLTAVQDIVQAWTGIGAAIYALWQQTKVASSTWTLPGVVSYLACVFALQTASTTIMQFTAFNNCPTISIQSNMAWPNTTILANETFSNTFYEGLPPTSLLLNIQTTGLLNNTLYDILTTTDSSFTNASVNATSVQSNCGLLSNLTFSNLDIQNLSFSGNGIGSGYFLLNSSTSGEGPTPSVHSQVTRNQIVLMSDYSNPYTIIPYLFFLITTDVVLDGSISESTSNLSINIATAGSGPIMAYLAVCSLSSQQTNATLNPQTGTLIPSPTLASSKTWKLWTPGVEESSELASLANAVLYGNAFGICPQNDFAPCSMYNNASFSTANSSLYTLPPNKLQQAIEDSVAAIIWTAGQLGSSQGGFDRMTGESQVIQVITKWRLNINTVPVVFASTASLILFILVLCLIRIPSKLPQYGTSITGLSVLETLWVAAHSQTLCENMADVTGKASLDDLRRVGMFKVCLSNIRGSQSDEAEGETFLE